MKNIRLALIATILATTTLGLSACNQTYSGTLNMILDLMVSTKSGVETVSRGTYAAKLKIKSRREVELEIKGTQNNDLDIPLRITNNSTLPNNGNGPIFVSGADNGQNFNVVGNMTTTARDSNIYRDYRQCTWQEARRECLIDANGRERCRIVYYTRYGNQWVEFFEREYTETISAELKIITDGRVAGNFSASERYYERYETYRSQCW